MARRLSRRRSRRRSPKAEEPTAEVTTPEEDQPETAADEAPPEDAAPEEAPAEPEDAEPVEAAADSEDDIEEAPPEQAPPEDEAPEAPETADEAEEVEPSDKADKKRGRKGRGRARRSRRGASAKESKRGAGAKEARRGDSRESRRAARPPGKPYLKYIILGAVAVIALVLFLMRGQIITTYYARQLAQEGMGFQQREQIHAALAGWRATGVPVLVDMVREHPVPDVRDAAAEAIGYIAAACNEVAVPDREVIDPLASLALGRRFDPPEDYEPTPEEKAKWDVPLEVRRNAVYGLGYALRESAGQALAEVLRPEEGSADPELARVAAWSAGRIPHASGVEACLEALRHRNKDVQGQAHESLLQIAAPAAASDSGAKAVGLVLKALSEDRPAVVAACEAAVPELGKKAGVEDVLPLLSQEAREESGWQSRVHAIRLLAHIGKRESQELAVVNALTDLINDDPVQDQYMDPDWHVRKAALKALADIGAPESLPFISNRLERDANEEVRVAAAQALSVPAYQSRATVANIILLLGRRKKNEESDAVVLAALNTLAACGPSNIPPESVDSLKAHLKELSQDPDVGADVRARASELLQ